MPEHEAIVTSTQRISYYQLVNQVYSLSKHLKKLGVDDKSCVGILCPEQIEHLVLCLAIIATGATSFTIPSYESNESQTLLKKKVDCTQVVTEKDYEVGISLISSKIPNGTEKINDSDTSIAAIEPRLLFTTSGSTGEPKLVIHFDEDIVAQAHRHIQSSEERFACMASIEHNFAKRHRLYCLAMGATNVLLGENEELPSLVKNLDINVLHVSAFQAQSLLSLQAKHLLSGIRLKLGGSHVPLSLRQELKACISNNLQTGYGTTETGAIAFTDPNDSDLTENVGKALPGIEVKVMDTNNLPVSDGEHGEIAIRCEGMFRGYLGAIEATKKRLRGDWFHTGDIGYIDEQRRIHLSGRADDMFVFNSINIYPQDLESLITQHPSVAEAVVIPKPSSIHGHIPEAIVVLKNGEDINLKTLDKFIRKRAGLRSPRKIHLVSAIPRNSAGKVSKLAAKNIIDISENVWATLERALTSSNVLNASHFDELGRNNTDIKLKKLNLDSIASMELLVAIETSHDVVITPRELSGAKSLRGLANHIQEQIKNQKEIPSQINDSPYPLSKRQDAQKNIPFTLPPIANLFNRILRICPTAAQLNKALTTLENRITPNQIWSLSLCHAENQLIPSDYPDKIFETANRWLTLQHKLLLESAKDTPEPYLSQRISPCAVYFYGPGNKADKTIILCFSVRGGRRLSVPNAALMQQADAKQFDFLVIAEPLAQSYRHGVPHIGKNITEVMNWLSSLSLLKEYGSLRTLGCSAGGYPAIVAGHLLGAELSVAVASRFNLVRKNPIKFLERVFHIWLSRFKGNSTHLLLPYAIDASRDRKSAKLISFITGGHLVSMQFEEPKVHAILEYLFNLGYLGPFLQNTIFADDPVGAGSIIQRVYK